MNAQWPTCSCLLSFSQIAHTQMTHTLALDELAQSLIPPRFDQRYVCVCVCALAKRSSVSAQLKHKKTTLDTNHIQQLAFAHFSSHTLFPPFRPSLSLPPPPLKLHTCRLSSISVLSPSTCSHCVFHTCPIPNCQVSRCHVRRHPGNRASSLSRRRCLHVDAQKQTSDRRSGG